MNIHQIIILLLVDSLSAISTKDSSEDINDEIRLLKCEIRDLKATYTKQREVLHMQNAEMQKLKTLNLHHEMNMLKMEKRNTLFTNYCRLLLGGEGGTSPKPTTVTKPATSKSTKTIGSNNSMNMNNSTTIPTTIENGK